MLLHVESWISRFVSVFLMRIVSRLQLTEAVFGWSIGNKIWLRCIYLDLLWVIPTWFQSLIQSTGLHLDLVAEEILKVLSLEPRQPKGLSLGRLLLTKYQEGDKISLWGLNPPVAVDILNTVLEVVIPTYLHLGSKQHYSWPNLFWFKFHFKLLTLIFFVCFFSSV